MSPTFARSWFIRELFGDYPQIIREISKVSTINTYDSSTFASRIFLKVNSQRQSTDWLDAFRISRTRKERIWQASGL